MAKVKGPLHSVGATGKFSGLTFGNYQGISFCKIRTHKRDFKTDKQLDNRKKYRDALIYWKAHPEIHADYNKAAAGKPYSGFNLYIKEKMSFVGYKRSVTIDNTGNADVLTNYQALVTLDTASLISAGKMREDCGDIRFKDSDGIAELKYWIESGINTANTKIWVKVPLIPASGTKQIWLYYGDLGLTGQSNGSATFDFFDDFDPDKVSWTVRAGTWSNVAGYSGNSKKGVHGAAGGRSSLANGQVSLADFVLHARVRSTVDNSLANIIVRAATDDNDGNNRIWVRLDQRASAPAHEGGFHLFENVAGNEYVRAYYDFNPVVAQWYGVVVKFHGASAEGYLDGIQRWSTTSLSKQTAGYILLQVEHQSGHDAWFDNLFIRKYTSPEPSTSVGPE